MSHLVMAKELEEEILRAQIDDPTVTISGNLFNTGIEIGIPGEEPYCIIVPAANHRTKSPTGFGYYNPPIDENENEQVQIVNYIIRTDLHSKAYERSNDRNDFIDIISMFNDRLAKELDIDVIAYSTSGIRIHLERDGELHVMCGHEMILEIHFDLPNRNVSYDLYDGDAIQFVYYGQLYMLRCPDLSDPQQLLYISRSMIASIDAATYSNNH